MFIQTTLHNLSIYILYIYRNQHYESNVILFNENFIQLKLTIYILTEIKLLTALLRHR